MGRYDRVIDKRIKAGSHVQHGGVGFRVLELQGDNAKLAFHKGRVLGKEPIVVPLHKVSPLDMRPDEKFVRYRGR